jgi:spore coat protein CotH
MILKLKPRNRATIQKVDMPAKDAKQANEMISVMARTALACLPMKPLPAPVSCFRVHWCIAISLLLPFIAQAGVLNTTTRSEAAAATDEFFARGAIPDLRIEIDQKNMKALRRDARAYVRATVREGARVYEEVGIHLKGAAGSYREIDSGEPALTLKFDRFRAGQNFHGLDKLHLNNSVQDSSLMCEAICARLFLQAGVPTARTTHARVWLNGEPLNAARGLYVLKEGYDKTFLRRYFVNPNGNLYDGGLLTDITEELELDSGPGAVPERADLKALASAAQSPMPLQRLEQIERLLDVDRFLDFVALETMTWHWDGYTMKKNNYRVYHDPTTDKMIFIPHGMDQMFWYPNRGMMPAPIEGIVAHGLLTTAEGRRRYRIRFTSILTNIFTTERLTSHLDELEGRLRTALAAISSDRVREWEGEADKVRNQVLTRVEFLHGRAGEFEPAPLQFDASNSAHLTKWTPEDPKRTSTLDTPTDSDGKKALHIVAGPNCIASWRTRVLLGPGHYVLEARMRTAGVVPLSDEPVKKGVGAGIRISRADSARPNGLIGDNAWQKVEYEFSVAQESEEPWLICELRASQGEAWFDLASLRLRRR